MNQQNAILYKAESGNLQPLAPLGNGEWVGQFSSSRQPKDAVRFSISDLNPANFKSLTGLWNRTGLTPAEDFRWKSHDGLAIQGWLSRPQGKARGTVIYVHGGPTGHSTDAVNNEIQFYVRCRFNVLDPNYRGSTGFDVIFRDAILKRVGAPMNRWTSAPGSKPCSRRASPNLGKLPSLALPLADTQPGVPSRGCGVTDLVIDYEVRPEFRPLTDEIFGGSPNQVPEKYFNALPINFVHNIVGGLLIIQGMQDVTVSPENVHMAAAALQKAGIPYETLIFDDEGHGIVKPKNQRKLYLELARFFEHNFG